MTRIIELEGCKCSGRKWLVEYSRYLGSVGLGISLQVEGVSYCRWGHSVYIREVGRFLFVARLIPGDCFG